MNFVNCRTHWVVSAGLPTAGGACRPDQAGDGRPHPPRQRRSQEEAAEDRGDDGVGGDVLLSFDDALAGMR